MKRINLVIFESAFCKNIAPCVSCTIGQINVRSGLIKGTQTCGTIRGKCSEVRQNETLLAARKCKARQLSFPADVLYLPLLAIRVSHFLYRCA